MLLINYCAGKKTCIKIVQFIVRKHDNYRALQMQALDLHEMAETACLLYEILRTNTQPPCWLTISGLPSGI